MAEGAQIHSTDALSQFRAALIKFAEGGNVALSSADSDIDRVLGWLERDQTVYWAGQVRKRHDLVIKWEDAVRQKRLYKNVDGTTQSAVDEQKALTQAKRAEEEARQKEVMVKRAIGTLRKESMLYKGRVQKLATTISSDIPNAVRTLDHYLDQIAAYLAIQTTGKGVSLGETTQSIGRQASSEKVGLEKLRDRTPKSEARQAAAFIAVGPDHAMLQPWKIGTMADWQAKALGTLNMTRSVLDPEARVVMLPNVWESAKVYLERVEPTSDSDSGWFIGSAEDGFAPAENQEYIAMRLGDLVSARTDFAELATLPGGTLIVLDAGGPTAIFDAMGLDIWSLALINSAEPGEPGSEAAEASPETALTETALTETAPTETAPTDPAPEPAAASTP